MKIQVTGERPVDAIEVRGGQQSTVIDVTAGTVTSVNGRTGAVTITSSDVGAPDWINVVQRGAAGDGVHDDTAAIQAAISTCPPGGIVYFPRGVYKTTATLDLKSGVTLLGSHSNLMVGPGMGNADYPCYIQAAGPFTGTAVIQIIGDADGTHPAISGEQRILNLMIDGSQLASTSIDGLYARGNVQNVVLDDFCIRQMPNNGIVTAANAGGQWPFSWRMRHVMADGCHAHGFLFSLMTDLTAIDCQAIGSWANGWVLTNLPNSQFTNCRAEWCGNHGYLINGDWGNGAGSGGAIFTGCSTDRNGWDGIHVSATGTAPLQFNGLMLRRDGRNGGTGGGGYAGLAVAASGMPVVASNVTCFPGVDDTGTSTSSPQYGVSVTGSSTLVQMDDASLHAATKGLNDDGTSVVALGSNIAYATGATSAPVRSVQSRTPDWINVSRSPYNAVGDGATDDKAAIQAALNACPKGGTVYLPAKQYALSSKLTIPPYVTLRGPLADRDGAGDGAACLLPKIGFTDTTVIELVDQTAGGYATANRDVTLVNVTIDGRLLTTETVQGIRATGYVHGVQLRDVSIHKVTGHAINLVNGASGNPYSWYMENVQISGAGSVTTWDGFHLIGTDHQLVACRALGVRGNGYYLNGCANTQLLGCRSEWSAVNGYYITGSYGTGNGSGALQMTSCSTDRNSSYGILIDSTGNPPILITGFMARRDGRNGFPGTGGGSFAALRGTGSTTPIIVHGMTCYPGVGDDGLGVNSPERGVSFVSCTYVSVEASYLHADTTPFHDGGSNTALYRGVAVGTATGTTAAPTRSLVGANNLPGPITLTQGGFLAVRGASTNTILNAQVTGDTQNRHNVTVAGTQTWGTGGATPDTTAGRAASGVWYTSKNALIGSATALGDNGVGEIQLADAATAPTTNPAGGSVVYSQSAAAVPLRMRDVSGNVRGLVSAEVIAAAAQNNSTTTQAASTSLTIPVEASATYRMTGMLVIQSPSGVNFTHSFTGPSGAAMTWGDTTATYIASLTGVDTWSGTGANRAANIAGTLVTSTTAGNLVVTFASGTAGQTATLGQNSWLRLERIK